MKVWALDWKNESGDHWVETWGKKPTEEELDKLAIKYDSEENLQGPGRAGSYAYVKVEEQEVQNMPESYENLDIFYNHQFVQNESTNSDSGIGADIIPIEPIGANWISNYNPLEHTPILEGTVTGSVFHGENHIQSFTIDTEGTFTFKDMTDYRLTVKAISGKIDWITGQLSLEWNFAIIGLNYAQVSYEYKHGN